VSTSAVDAETRRAVLATRAARLAARGSERAQAGQQERCVFSSFGGHRLAIPAVGVRFVTPAPPITLLPGLPPWFAGLAAPRGELLAAIDPRVLAGRAPTPLGQGRFLIVLQGRPGSLGLVMDTLEGFGDGDLDALRPAPFEGGLPLAGVWDDGTGLLDVEALLADARMVVGAEAGAPGAGGGPGGEPWAA